MTRSIAAARVGTQDIPYSLRVVQATGNGITATTSSAVNSLAQMSVAGWYYLYSYGNTNLGRLFYKGQSTGDNAWLEMYQGANNLLNVFSAWGVQGQWKTTVPLIGNWHHIVVTYDGSSSSNAPVIYVDGASSTIAVTQTPSGNRTADTTNLNVGAAGFSTARYSNSAICQFRIFNRILTAQEVLNLYQTGTVPSGLALEYLMNEGSGSTVTDTSGNGNNGTNTGCVYMTNSPSKLRSVISTTRSVASGRQSV